MLFLAFLFSIICSISFSYPFDENIFLSFCIFVDFLIFLLVCFFLIVLHERTNKKPENLSGSMFFIFSTFSLHNIKLHNRKMIQPPVLLFFFLLSFCFYIIISDCLILFSLNGNLNFPHYFFFNFIYCNFR